MFKVFFTLKVVEYKQSYLSDLASLSFNILENGSDAGLVFNWIRILVSRYGIPDYFHDWFSLFQKRIRENLRQAATGSDIEEIEHAIELFEKNKLEDNGDLEDAQERLEFLYLRKGKLVVYIKCF